MQFDVLQFANNTLALIVENPIVFGLGFIVFLLLIQNLLLGKRISRLTKGASGQSLERVIHKLDERTELLEKYARSSSEKIKSIDARVETSIRGIATERFDPFQGSGGQQSFTSAFLNEQGDGVVISGIHSRDGVRVYAKQVQDFKSERELSEEEQKAIKKAQKNLA